ncbi:D-alanine--D-alanine ligase [Propionicimonas paludicola]|uniref:D-alanine--D-alanine ligase n=1 Tax=Propionicimonas paludicola TaxID=185243 RepID=A0A2A9CR04_9ACTN|nr:D-alanine--D-alanine ligase family protein [Propionicimonas paludicola]PFG16556.1 D-alanine--D-alanine ligase [Propionicimonas paludicola]
MTGHPQRTRVALVFGGVSPEHPVSCLTAGSVARAIDAERYQVIGVGITTDGAWVRIPTDELIGFEVKDGHLPQVAEDRPAALLVPVDGGAAIATRVEDRLTDLEPFDVAFALLHGPYGEDGTIQGLFEMLGVRYVGAGVAASAIGMDKDLMKRSMAAAGLPVGPWVAITPSEWTHDQAGCLARIAELSYPLFVKPARGGSSLGISQVDAIEQLIPAIEAARALDPKVVIEQGFTGVREIECAVLGDPDRQPKVSQPGEIVMHGASAFYDFDAKYLPEDQVRLDVPAKLDPAVADQLRDLARRTFVAMDVEGLARVDLFLDADGKAWVNELNTMPGFTRTSMFPMMWAEAGLSYSELIGTLLELALRRPLGLR